MGSDNESVPLFDRDYSDEFAVTLEWHEWNKLFSLMRRGVDEKRGEDWPEEEYERDRELQDKLVARIGENSPGNGMADWPDSMKEAHGEAVRGLLKEFQEGEK